MCIGLAEDWGDLKLASGVEVPIGVLRIMQEKMETTIMGLYRVYVRVMIKGRIQAMF